MSKFRTNYRIKSIDSNEYTMKSDNSTHKLKVLNLERLTKDEFTGEWMKSVKNGTAKAQVFPFNIVSAQNVLGYEFVPNETYNDVEVYKAKGAKYPLAFLRLDTSNFNFPGDGVNPEPRKSLNVSVLVDEGESDEQITNNFIGQAMYQLRTLGVTIFDEYGNVAMYTPRNSKDEIPAISSTEAQHKVAVAEASARTAKLFAAVKIAQTTKTKPVVEFDEVSVRDTFVAANPNATQAEIDEYMLAEMEAFESVNAA